MRIHFPTLGIAGVGVEPTSNGAGSPHACAGWATVVPVRMEAMRGHSPGNGSHMHQGVWPQGCIKGCGHKGEGVISWRTSEEQPSGIQGVLDPPPPPPPAPCDPVTPGGWRGPNARQWKTCGPGPCASPYQARSQVACLGGAKHVISGLNHAVA